MEFVKAVAEISRFLEGKTSYLFYVGLSRDAHSSLVAHNVDINDIRLYRIITTNSEDTAYRIQRYFRENYQLQGVDEEPKEGYTQVYIFKITENTSPSL